MRSLSHVTLLVDDQDEAHDFYAGTLGFETRDDDEFGEASDRRWLTVALPDDAVEIALVPADTDGKRAAVGRQAGDHVPFVITTGDCRGEYERLSDEGVTFHGEPTEQPWGVAVTFERYSSTTTRPTMPAPSWGMQ
jgi:catechol 2,3-dioxygenase-like lactoylglutathione lyase family enzyme